MKDPEKLDQDVRLIRRNLAKGFVSREKIEQMMDGLPDVAEQGEWIDVEAEEGEAAGETKAEDAAKDGGE